MCTSASPKKTELSYEEALALKDELQKRQEIQEVAADHVGLVWKVFTSPDMFKATNFLNTSPVTPAGHAIVTNRADGKVDVYWLL